jgi:hypothetical protein
LIPDETIVSGSKTLIDVGGTVAIYFGSGFIKEQVLAYRQGRHFWREVATPSPSRSASPIE